jgi:hypothetical protein
MQKTCTVCAELVPEQRQYECDFCEDLVQCSMCRVMCDTCHAPICDECSVIFMNGNPTGQQCHECALLCTQCNAFPSEILVCSSCDISVCSGVNEAGCYKGVVIFAGTQPDSDNERKTPCGQLVEYAWCRSCTDERENSM